MIDPGVRDDGPAITGRLLRQFAGLWLAFLGGLALYHGLARGRAVLAVVLGVAAAVGGVAGLVAPRAIEPLFRTAMAIAMPIGFVISNILLAVIFYLIITPISLFFRVIGRDALARRLSSGARSQWIEREQTTDPRRYWHQS